VYTFYGSFILVLDIIIPDVTCIVFIISVNSFVWFPLVYYHGFYYNIVYYIFDRNSLYVSPAE